MLMLDLAREMMLEMQSEDSSRAFLGLHPWKLIWQWKFPKLSRCVSYWKWWFSACHVSDFSGVSAATSLYFAAWRSSSHETFQHTSPRCSICCPGILLLCLHCALQLGTFVVDESVHGESSTTWLLNFLGEYLWIVEYLAIVSFYYPKYPDPSSHCLFWGHPCENTGWKNPANWRVPWSDKGNRVNENQLHHGMISLYIWLNDWLLEASSYNSLPC